MCTKSGGCGGTPQPLSSCGSLRSGGVAERGADPVALLTSPPPVTLDRWRTRANGRQELDGSGTTLWDPSRSQAEDRQVQDNDRDRPAQSVFMGSIELRMDRTNGGVGAHSDHLPGSGQEGISPRCSLVEGEFDTEFACTTSFDASAERRTPTRVQTADMFQISLMAGTTTPICPAMVGDAPCSPCTPVDNRSPVDVLCIELRKALSPILAAVSSRAPPATTRRPRQKRQPASNPRRSVRLARGVGHRSNATKQQNILIQKLCLANEGEVISDEALEAYAKLFEQPLTEVHIKAILAVFGWEPSVLPLMGHDGVAEDGN